MRGRLPYRSLDLGPLASALSVPGDYQEFIGKGKPSKGEVGIGGAGLRCAAVAPQDAGKADRLDLDRVHKLDLAQCGGPRPLPQNSQSRARGT